MFQCPPTSPKGMVGGLVRSSFSFSRSLKGSLKELETQSILAERLSYTTSGQVASLLSDSERIGKRLGSLIRSLKAKDAN